MRTHTKESTAASQSILNECQPKFSQQCKDLLIGMLKGRTYNTKSAMLLHDVWRLSSRISDLVLHNKVPVHKERKRNEQEGFSYIEFSILPEHRNELIKRFNIAL